MKLATDAAIYFTACTPVVAQDNLRMLAHKKAAVDPRMQASNPCAHILKRTWDVRMYYKPATAKYGQKGISRRSNASFGAVEQHIASDAHAHLCR